MTSLLVAAVLASSPVEMSAHLGVAGHLDPDSRSSMALIPLPTLTLTACLDDRVVLEGTAGWLFFYWDASALGGWSWRVLGDPREGTVIDVRALVGVHDLHRNSLFGEATDFPGGVAAAEVDLVQWGYPPSPVAFSVKLRVGAETVGTSVHPLAHLALGVTL